MKDWVGIAFPKSSKTVLKAKPKTKVSKSTYNEVFEACKGSCVLCGAKQNLELHHVLGRGKELTDNPRYCVMLCQKCHHEVVHKNQKKYRPVLLKKCEVLYGK